MADATAEHPAQRYHVTATTTGSGVSTIRSKQSDVVFDSSPRQDDELPGPADLLIAAFAACILKNVERMGELLPFAYDQATVEVDAERQDSPPKITRITYALTVTTDERDQRVDLLHRNIKRHGTIFNTVAAACDVTGTITARPPGAEP
ncbi:MAG: OsmC family protein [Microthrixaceae bacterium]|nr:OsmC family protein [Microthrixaceae bacterium]